MYLKVSKKSDNVEKKKKKIT